MTRRIARLVMLVGLLAGFTPVQARAKATLPASESEVSLGSSDGTAS